MVVTIANLHEASRLRHIDVDVRQPEAVREGRPPGAHHARIDLERLHQRLRVGVDHLDRDRLNAWDSGGHLPKQANLAGDTWRVACGTRRVS